MEPREYTTPINPKKNSKTGHWYFVDKQHPLAWHDGTVNLARHLVSVRIGRWLQPDESVAQADDDKDNLDLDNLQLVTRSELMQRGRPDKVQLICAYCGVTFDETPSHAPLRRFHSEECQKLGLRKFDVSAEELQQLVWEMPTTAVAAKFGVSDKAVEKRCKLLGVQKPPRGYWAKKAKEEARGKQSAQGATSDSRRTPR